MRKNLILPLLLACGLLAFTGCGDPEGDDNDNSGDPSKPKLSISISRAANTTPGQFTFTVTNPPAGSQAYSVYDSHSKIADFPNPTINLSSTGIPLSKADGAFTPLVVDAKGTSGALSADTPVPGIRRYPAATTNSEGMTDWFNFLDKAIAGLAAITLPQDMSTIIAHTNFRSSVITPSLGTLSNESTATDIKDSQGTPANAATSAVLAKYNEILTHYAGDAASLKIIKDALPRLWLNNVTNHTGTMLQHVKSQLNAAGYSHVNFN